MWASPNSYRRLIPSERSSILAETDGMGIRADHVRYADFLAADPSGHKRGSTYHPDPQAPTS
jgi:hypothetical protein